MALFVHFDFHNLRFFRLRLEFTTRVLFEPLVVHAHRHTVAMGSSYIASVDVRIDRLIT